ncbi:replication initiator, partial [Umezawaea endophytica]
SDATPAWATSELLDHSVKLAARSVETTTVRPDGTELLLVWGTQVDAQPIRASSAHEVEDESGAISEQRLAGYVAKYATKGTGKTEAADRPIKSQLEIDYLRVATHHRAMIQTAWDLGHLPQYAELNLVRWAHMLGFRGHFLSKSKAYSTTFRAIRGERRAFRAQETLDRLGYTADSVTVVNDWQWTGSGYKNDAERELASAISQRVREHRRRKYEEEAA